MDNRQINITSEGKSDFELAMKLIAGNNKATAYRIHNNHLVFYWCISSTCTTAIPFPYALDVQQMTEFAWGWLQVNKPTESEPDHDGDNHPGFMVFNEDWGHVFNQWEAFAAITPIWAMYGK